jgi:hypothetical protein
MASLRSRFFANAQNNIFTFPVFLNVAKDLIFLMFFEKEKEEILRWLQNDITDDTIVVLRTLVRRISFLKGKKVNK